jgi:predicted transcriptional regulator
MSKQNVTVQLDQDVIARAKVLAARRGTSVSRLVARQIEDLVEADARYEAAWERARKAMGDAVSRGGRTWEREDLYDRWERRKG